MKRFVALLALILLISSATAKTASFETDSSKNVSIGGEKLNLELVGVHSNSNQPEIYDATFLTGSGATATVVSWNAHKYDYIQSQLNGEYIVLDDWSGASTDTNTDDTATLSWGTDYFPCESYQTDENQHKFCGESTKTIEIGGEDVQLEFLYSDVIDEHEQIKKAVFLNGEGATVTLVSGNAPQYGYSTSQVNGVKVVVTQVRGAHTESTKDDAALIEKFPAQECTYDLKGTVEGGTYNSDVKGKVYLGDHFTTITSEKTFGWTVTQECGTTAKLEYREDGKTLATKKVELPSQGGEVTGITIDASRDTFRVRKVERITDYLGGNVDNVKSMTEIRFGDNLQNSLFVKKVEGGRFGKITAYTGTSQKDFTLTEENAVEGIRKSFSSGEYTVHLCSTGYGSEEVSIAIAKTESGGYQACFEVKNEAGGNASDYTEVDHDGKTVTMAEGQKVRFGNGDRNIFYLQRVSYVENIDRYQLTGYANKLLQSKSVLPVEGTATEAYFANGKIAVYFCEAPAKNKAKLAFAPVTSGKEPGLKEICGESSANPPSGTINFGSSTYQKGDNATLHFKISEPGRYRINWYVNGDQFDSSTVPQGQAGKGTMKHVMNQVGNVTAEMVAPGAWWNPLDSDKVVSVANARVLETSKEPGDNDTTTQNRTGIIVEGAPFEVGDSATLHVKLGETLASSGYRLTVRSPGNRAVLDKTGEVPRRNFSFTITSGMKPGTYTARLKPTGRLKRLFGALTGGNAYDTETFEVKGPETLWKSYCLQEGYPISSVEGQINCIKQTIVPNCFKKNPGKQCGRVGQSVCKNLLGYDFSPSKGKCVK
ncbi:MAG: hypothetical protein ABEJ75_01505 [Candidatus Nanohaloarchaea archaeon]